MKRIIILFFTLAPLVAVAQDQPQTKGSDKPIEAAKPKEAPVEAILDAATVKTLLDKAKDARIAQLEINNLQLQIEKAQQQLKELSERAEKLQDESKAAYQRAAIKAGIPGDELENYVSEPQQSDGTIKLKRKAAPKK
jgi:TolA-binding protein